MREVWADANRPLPACQLSCILSLGTEWTIHKYLIFVTSSPTSAYPLVRHLPNGQTVPLLPSPVQMTSVISVSHFKNVKIVLFILFLCYLFTLSICFSLSLSGFCCDVELARPVNSVPNIPGIPGPPVGGASSGSSSPSGYSMNSETRMVR